MARTLKDFIAEHPVDRERVEVHKVRMLAEFAPIACVNCGSRPDSRKRNWQSVSVSGSDRFRRSNPEISTVRRSAPSATTSRPG